MGRSDAGLIAVHCGGRDVLKGHHEVHQEHEGAFRARPTVKQRDRG